MMRAEGYTKFAVFIRSGTELLHMERFDGMDGLPPGWAKCEGTRFYANFIGRRE
jgi:hypothetical protein